jgi:hypothetical protein
VLANNGNDCYDVTSLTLYLLINHVVSCVEDISPRAFELLQYFLKGTDMVGTQK